MKVLITGITGMAGSHLADHLIKNEPKVEIHGTRRWRSRTENIDHIRDRIVLHECELVDYSNVHGVLSSVRPDAIFHLAAQSFVPASWHSPAATLADNASMQVNLFEVMLHLELDVPIQIALSSEEYGLVHENEVPISEDNPLRPLSPYAVSKVTQDMMGYQYHQSHGLKVIRTRTFNHEGPRRGDVFVTSNFARQIAEIELGLKPPVIEVGNLDARRDWSDVRDVARAYWLSIRHCTPGEVYVIGSGKSRTVRQMLDTLLGLSDVNVQVRQDPSRLRPSDVPILEANPTKFRKATGWEPEIPFEQTMKDLLEYWRDRLRRGLS
jgi:GDP-4-dehydro-6-deoxy-D-mannose reductase